MGACSHTVPSGADGIPQESICDPAWTAGTGVFGSGHALPAVPIKEVRNEQSMRLQALPVLQLLHMQHKGQETLQRRVGAQTVVVREQVGCLPVKAHRGTWAGDYKTPARECRKRCQQKSPYDILQGKCGTLHIMQTELTDTNIFRGHHICKRSAPENIFRR